MHTLAFAAGIGVMDKYGLPDFLKIIHKDMVDYSVSEVGRKDLPEFWLYGKKADRTGGAVCAGLKLLLQHKQILFLLYLKMESIKGISLVPPAMQILPVDIFKRK